MPEPVHTDKEGCKIMSYDRVTALLVRAVKELKKKSNSKIAALISLIALSFFLVIASLLILNLIAQPG